MGLTAIAETAEDAAALHEAAGSAVATVAV
jgi:hypothetical protein